jgi:hypothetical protein
MSRRIYPPPWLFTCSLDNRYGDISATNSNERVVGVLILLITGMAWASIIGDICGVLATLDTCGVEFRDQFDQVNMMMEDLAVGQSMRQEVRAFLYKAEEKIRTSKYKGLLYELSPKIRTHLAIFLCRPMIVNVAYFRLLHFPREILGEIALRCVDRVYSPDEDFGRPRTLFVLQRGSTYPPPHTSSSLAPPPPSSLLRSRVTNSFVLSCVLRCSFSLLVSLQGRPCTACGF